VCVWVCVCVCVCVCCVCVKKGKRRSFQTQFGLEGLQVRVVELLTVPE
jgi:hypothetical protein